MKNRPPNRPPSTVIYTQICLLHSHLYTNLDVPQSFIHKSGWSTVIYSQTGTPLALQSSQTSHIRIKITSPKTPNSEVPNYTTKYQTHHFSEFFPKVKKPES